MVNPERDRGESAIRRPHARPGKSAAAFRTISEVADELEVAQHVLRFWESKFPQVRPLKRGGGRRYYRPEDVDLLRQIRSLLYEEGYTIRGAQKLLKGQRRVPDGDNGAASRSGEHPAQKAAARAYTAHASSEEEAEAAPAPATGGGPEFAPEVRARLVELRAELLALRRVLRDVTG